MREEVFVSNNKSEMNESLATLAPKTSGRNYEPALAQHSSIERLTTGVEHLERLDRKSTPRWVKQPQPVLELIQQPFQMCDIVMIPDFIF
eukprot:CAMPEP_0172624964 /NCGR_PEP_ID=MMETSP1068-20121228/140504_1 /TAXON_ID=35684 /ORGANISM="Pseudopedinella elastica, Strain CCMP716" /LENGTH=89 /DNA_ID=CAMNT_0013434111 /DNA_START=398 /DNA_END=667 /DNA_ORIENTATION=-